ncbi:MAG TPA: DUF5060 domain-containing protein [Bryobacteraceae bacterium]|jgi:hypothetical protein
MLYLLWIALAAAPLFAETNTCANTPVWTTCDLTFDLAANENAATADVRAEFRSLRHRTYLMYAFAEGSRLTIRFAPTEEGEWDYRLTSNIARLNEQTGKFTAATSDAPGFVKTANVHHFATDRLDPEPDQPHLWMGSAIDNFLKLPRADFDRAVEQLASQKFNHARVTLEPDADLREAADRIRALNSRGLTADLVLAAIPEDAPARRKYIQAIASRLAPFNVTWMGVPAMEKLPHARALLKDAGQLLKQFDPYNHPRTSMADVTSGPLSSDQWTTFRSYGTSDPNVGAIEQQLYATPAVNTGIRSSRDLWNATMNGQYPASGSGPYMTAWFDFMSANRHWELEPYFDLDGGRALALDGIEYIVYIEKPGPVEVTVEDHGYNVVWINPATGERTRAKDYKGTHFTGTPPDNKHDWVLQISRESEKQRMLKSYKFTSRDEPIRLQTVEVNPEKTPFEVATPEEGALPAGPVPASIKVTRNSRATRTLLVEWTAEVTADGEGYRVAGVGNPGTLNVPRSLAHTLPASVLLHVYVLNALGKVYELDRVNRLVP